MPEEPELVDVDEDEEEEESTSYAEVSVSMSRPLLHWPPTNCQAM